MDQKQFGPHAKQILDIIDQASEPDGLEQRLLDLANAYNKTSGLGELVYFSEGLLPDLGLPCSADMLAKSLYRKWGVINGRRTLPLFRVKPEHMLAALQAIYCAIVAIQVQSSSHIDAGLLKILSTPWKSVMC